MRVERRVSCRGCLAIAGQRIHIGIAHAGANPHRRRIDPTFDIHDGDQILTEVARTTTTAMARFKARKPRTTTTPEHPRHRRSDPKLTAWRRS